MMAENNGALALAILGLGKGGGGGATYEAGEGIDITDEVISVDDGVVALKEDLVAIEEAIDEKQDTISDLDDIRAGAALGETALQEVPEGYATEDYVDEALEDKQDVLTAGEGIDITDATVSVDFNLVTSITKLNEELGYKQDTLTAGENITIVNNVISAAGGSSVEIDNKTIVENDDGEIQVYEGGSGWSEYTTLEAGAVLNGTSSDWDTVYDSEIIDSVFNAINNSGKTEFEVQLTGAGVDLSKYVKFVWVPTNWTSERIGQNGDLHCFVDNYNYESAELYVDKSNNNIHIYGAGYFNPVLGSKIIVRMPEFEAAYEQVTIETAHKIADKYLPDFKLYKTLDGSVNYSHLVYHNATA